MKYVINRMRFWCVDVAENFIMGAERRDTKSFSFRDSTLLRWTPSRELVEHHALKGLYAQREALSQKQIEDLLELGQMQSYRPYEWSQRQLAPLLLGEIEEDLRHFDVFDRVPPEKWRRAELSELPKFGKPRFAQFQMLQAGTPIMPHIDAAEPKADVVATYTLRGHAEVRIGQVQFEMGPGDLYYIRDDARWKVKHEVLPPREDRMSITIRYTD